MLNEWERKSNRYTEQRYVQQTKKGKQWTIIRARERNHGGSHCYKIWTDLLWDRWNSFLFDWKSDVSFYASVSSWPLSWPFRRIRANSSKIKSSSWPALSKLEGINNDRFYFK
jgi:hypothetical protein